MPTKAKTFNPNQHVRTYARQLKVADPFYSSTAWIRVRDVVRREEPLCQLCLALGITEATTAIGHKLPRWLAPDRELDRDNLYGICIACNVKQEHEDRIKYAAEWKVYNARVSQ